MTESVSILVSYAIMSSFSLIVAHELAHEPETRPADYYCGQLIYALQWKMHYPYEHNTGHHTSVGLAGDTETARRGESLYAFSVRHFAGTYGGAWADRAEHLGGDMAAAACFARWTCCSAAVTLAVAHTLQSWWAVLFILGTAGI